MTGAGRARGWLVAFAAAAVAGALAVPAPAAAACNKMDTLKVPGAELQESFCLSDMMTKSLAPTSRTDVSDWAGLHSKRSRNPAADVPGIQIEGYFPDTSKTNTWLRRNHDSQFVIRLPDRWNGKLVITGAPGVRRQYANDYIISDWVLARGYAFASTDKGNTGTSFYVDGKEPGDAVVEWHTRVAELTKAAKAVVRQRYGRAPRRTYMTGISNGGYLTRWQLERYPDLYDGGVDWEGTLFLAEGPNLFTYLPVALRNYPQAHVDASARKAMVDAGFHPDSDILWPDHHAVYWDLTQRVYREEFDPDFDGTTQAGTPFCRPGTIPGCDADYDYDARPKAVKDAVARVSLTGNIRKPMLTLHGDLDALLPIRTDSDIYTRMIREAGRGKLHRYYVVQGGNHVDDRADLFPTEVRPILPCYRDAFAHLEAWVEKGAAPPASRTVKRAEVADDANECNLRLATGANTGAGGNSGAGRGGGSNAGVGVGRGGGTSGAVGTGGVEAAAGAAGALPATGGSALAMLGGTAVAAIGLNLRRRQ